MKKVSLKLSLFCLTVLLIAGSSCNRCNDIHINAQFTDPFVEIERMDTPGINPNSYLNTYFGLRVKSISSTTKRSQQDVAYASIGPFSCEVEIIVDSFLNRLDSIKVFSNKAYHDSLELEITDLFSSVEHNLDLNDIRERWTQNNFVLTQGPLRADSFEFQFLFFDSNGDVFEFVTKQIPISD